MSTVPKLRSHFSFYAHNGRKKKTDKIDLSELSDGSKDDCKETDSSTVASNFGCEIENLRLLSLQRTIF